MKAVARLVAVLFVWMAAPAHATATAAAQAEAEMVKAKQAMEQRQFELAIVHLLAAQTLAPEASGPYLNLGLSYAALGRCDEAARMLEEYLRRKVRDPQPSATATLAACRAAAAAAPPAAEPSPAVAAAPDEDAAPLESTAPVAAAAPAAALDFARAGPPSVAAYHEPLVVRRKRVWPLVVGVMAGVALTGGIVALVVTLGASPQTNMNQPQANMNQPMSTPVETPFPTATLP